MTNTDILRLLALLVHTEHLHCAEVVQSRKSLSRTAAMKAFIFPQFLLQIKRALNCMVHTMRFGVIGGILQQLLPSTAFQAVWMCLGTVSNNLMTEFTIEETTNIWLTHYKICTCTPHLWHWLVLDVAVSLPPFDSFFIVDSCFAILLCRNFLSSLQRSINTFKSTTKCPQLYTIKHCYRKICQHTSPAVPRSDFGAMKLPV